MTLHQLEETTYASEIHQQAKAFFQNTLNDFDERAKTFNKYGELSNFTFKPKNKILSLLFDYKLTTGLDNDFYYKYEHINCLSLIDSYIDDLIHDRIILRKGLHHTKFDIEPRNYVPSAEALSRLEVAYTKLLFKESISHFNFDW